MMHILIMPSWYPDSAADINGVFFRDQAAALAATGNKVGVIVPEECSVRHFLFGRDDVGVIQCAVNDGVETLRRKYWGILPRLPFGKFILFRANARKL